MRAALARARIGGIEGHGALIDALIGLGELVQGLADRGFEDRGTDGPDPLVERLTEALVAIGGLVVRSWDEGLRPVTPLPEIATDVPDVPVTLKLAEGYAFYALYPEAIAAAARALRLDAPARVIGIRSIGTSLAAVAAAALDAAPPLTVRPVGHPFARHLAVDAALAERLLDGPAHYVIVDEGPGLSGSSFAAVAEWLEVHGVSRTRIAFLPSHGGEPGNQANAGTRARWATAQRPVIPFETLLTPERLGGWVETLVGPLEGALVDISGGAWRAHVYGRETDWPASRPASERRKFLATGRDDRRWLVKFAGLGRTGAIALDRARRLAAAGWIGEPAGIAHGFLVQAWIKGSPPASRAAAARHAAAVGRYLADRARLLPPPESAGASVDQLIAMARHNVREALGPEAAEAIDRRLIAPRAVRPMAIDGRLDLHEWIETPHGLRKADALDGDRSHDLVGAQDIAWDVAGAVVELDLDRAGRRTMLHAMEQGGCPVDEAELGFWTTTYLAFRLGMTRITLDSLGGWPEEHARNRAIFARYSQHLRAFPSK